MAIGLKELERRTYARSARRIQRIAPVGSMSAYRAPRVPFARSYGAAAAGDPALVAKLVANGMPQAKAEETAATLAQFDATSGQPAMASSLGLRMPTAKEITGVAKTAFLYAMSSTVFGPAGPLAVEAIFKLCDELNACIAFGIGGGAGAMEGFGASLGVVFSPGRKVGVFGSAGMLIGEIMGVSVGIQMTAVHGGLSAFNGTSYTMGVAIGEGLGGAGHIILNSQGHPIGFIAEIDLTGGSPIRAIGGIWETVSRSAQFSHRGLQPVRAYGHYPGHHTHQPHGPVVEAYTSKAREASFTSLAGVPVHYDRLPPDHPYGSTGVQRTFYCTNELKAALGNCMTDLFALWNEGTPTIILTAGTGGDGDNAHGQGNAFDLDGFWWGERRMMMTEYPANRALYIAIHAHLFHYFSQVLSWHYRGHRDHFHVDFNSANRNHYRTGSEAQAYFLQSVLKYIYNKDIGSSGQEGDGVDGDYGSKTRTALAEVLPTIGMAGKDITTEADWRAFITRIRTDALALVP